MNKKKGPAVSSKFPRQNVQPAPSKSTQCKIEQTALLLKVYTLHAITPTLRIRQLVFCAVLVHENIREIVTVRAPLARGLAPGLFFKFAVILHNFGLRELGTSVTDA